MLVLKSLVTDGTFDQLAPLNRLKGKEHLYYFDLQAATDTLPATISGSMLSGFFGDLFGASWLYLMTATGFRDPTKTLGKKYTFPLPSVGVFLYERSTSRVLFVMAGLRTNTSYVSVVGRLGRCTLGNVFYILLFLGHCYRL